MRRGRPRDRVARPALCTPHPRLPQPVGAASARAGRDVRPRFRLLRVPAARRRRAPLVAGAAARDPAGRAALPDRERRARVGPAA